jgi:hypothetical protein
LPSWSWETARNGVQLGNFGQGISRFNRVSFLFFFHIRARLFVDCHRLSHNSTFRGGEYGDVNFDLSLRTWSEMKVAKKSGTQIKIHIPIFPAPKGRIMRSYNYGYVHSCLRNDKTSTFRGGEYGDVNFDLSLRTWSEMKVAKKSGTGSDLTV